MAFTLGDVENDCLSLLGSNNPPPQYGVGGASTYPNWAAAVGLSRFDQGLVDMAINRSVARVISRLNDLDIVGYSYKFVTQSQVYAYAIPQGSVAQGTLTIAGTPAAGITLTVTIGGTAVVYQTTALDTSLAQVTAHLISAINTSAVVTGGVVIVPVSPALNSVNTVTLSSTVNGTAGNSTTLTATSSSGALTVTASGTTLAGAVATNPLCQQLRRVYYQPQGMSYNREKRAGVWLISWNEFQEKTNAGYLAPFSFSSEPDYVAMTPDRSTLNFYPGPANAGDIVTVRYVPQMTTGTGDPFLTAQTSVVPLPDDLRDAVVFGAMYWLWPVAGEIGMRNEARQEFDAEILRIRTDWSKGSNGDSQRIVDVMDARSATGWGAGL